MMPLMQQLLRLVNQVYAMRRKMKSFYLGIVLLGKKDNQHQNHVTHNQKACELIDIDEISLSDDIQVIPSKGKRKVSAKKQAEHVLKSASYGPSSPSKTPSKPLKWIKKEQN
ncbi:hypothetical protein QN277_002374 [Acacia crassicarpa]|uniref:Uncharacterized protein n=1 Tax=Acacia crassicarpa TaxID=499986 RepID=A0AAE1NAQ1_9FABA|nr:hypothetical protein QN277_002374 [Acacia crassicarpa]